MLYEVVHELAWLREAQCEKAQREEALLMEEVLRLDSLSLKKAQLTAFRLKLAQLEQLEQAMEWGEWWEILRLSWVRSRNPISSSVISIYLREE
jgi:hypothetical protein